MLTATEHKLVHDAFQYGDASGLPVFMRTAKTARAKKIAEHVAIS
jgi:hypothetical protein